MGDLSPGAVFTVPHPFVRDLFDDLDEDGPFKSITWRPGVRFAPRGPEDSEAVADGMGAQSLTIISVHRPGRYPTRVFYERRWVDPRGVAFGKRKLLIKVSSAFRHIIGGYRYPYRVATPEETAEFITDLKQKHPTTRAGGGDE